MKASCQKTETVYMGIPLFYVDLIRLFASNKVNYQGTSCFQGDLCYSF